MNKDKSTPVSWWAGWRRLALPALFLLGVIYYEELFLKVYCFHTLTVEGVVFTFLFFGWGLGLAQDMGPWPCLCAAVAVFLLQAWACRLWLSHFLYGPLEWLWRTATTCRMQPFKKPRKEQ